MTIAELQGLATLLATGAGIYVAVGGLNAWKREMTGKRDIELCQKVVEMFYEAEHKINVLRSPMSSRGESADRPHGEGESEPEAERLDYLFVPIARMNAQSDFWAELYSYRFRMRALFGDVGAEPFAKMSDAFTQFRNAAVFRYQSLQNDPNGLSIQQRNQLEKKIWAGVTAQEPDALSDLVKTAISAMEAICIPIVRSSQSQPSSLFRAVSHLINRIGYGRIPDKAD